MPTLSACAHRCVSGLMGTLGILTAYLYMQLKSKPADRTVIYVKKAASMTEPKPKWEKTTYLQHDMSELTAAATQVVTL